MKRTLLTALISIVLIIKMPAETLDLREMPDSMITVALEMVNSDSLQSYVQDLQDMGTRFMIAPNRKETATWIMNKFLSYGITEVRIDSFQCYSKINWPPLFYDTTTWQYNVEARIEGSQFPEDEVILIGHYDDATQDFDPMDFAPGADDNASGTAAALECARVIMEMGYQPGQTLIFLASAAEELMYYGDAGTEHYAAEAQAAGRNIVMAINNDMIAWNDGSWTLDLFNHILSPHITALAIEIIESYTTLNYDSWAPTYEVGGDIQPFLDAGYPGIYFMEHYINPNYHTVNDLIDYCDIPFLAENTKVSLGCILQSDITVGIDNHDKSATKQVSIYPNPAWEDICISFNDLDFTWDLKILDLSGKELIRHSGIEDMNHLDVSTLPEGIYLVVLSNEQNTLCKKLVIARK